MSSQNIYRGETVVIATMHAKERAVGKAFGRLLEANVIVAPGIDTDEFGTFTGEIARQGTMLDAARAKACAAIESTGFLLGLGSEGSFGPHPALPFIAAGCETLFFVDSVRDFTVYETLVTHRTNYSSCTCVPGDDVRAFLQSVGFPSHAVVVQSNMPAGLDITKGIRTLQTLREAIERAAEISRDGRALIVTDMRAHMNPTRMAVIRALSTKLARRLGTLCPACRTPGFGMVKILVGLPCAWCGEPTKLASAELHRCVKCNSERRIPKFKNETAEPTHCPYCNP